MNNLRTNTVKSASWILGSRVASQVISFGIGIVLARLLVPDDFGLIAMVVVFTGLASLLSNVGLGSALIQKNNVHDEHFNSVFWLNLLLSCSIALVLYFAAHAIGTLYGRLEVENICKMLSLGFIISGATLVPRTILAKKLSFKLISIADMVAMILSGLIAIVLASTGYGYWSLVSHILLQQIISAVIIWVVSDWRPNSGMKRAAIADLIGFSVSVFGTQVLQYATRNVDKLLLGKYLGAQSLGVYDKAFSMMLFPLQNVSHVIGSVMFPSLSLIQSDVSRVRDIYLRTTRAIALITFPMMGGMFVVAESFVLGVLGPQWGELIPVLQIFCIAGLATSIVTITGSLYQSQGAAALQFKVNLFTQPLKVVGIIAGLPWGIMGVAIGYSVTTFINTIITLSIAGKLIDLKLSALFRSIYPILFPTLIMVFAVAVLPGILKIESELLLFFLQSLLGGVVYFISIFILKLEAYLDVKNVLQEEYYSWKSRRIN